METNVKNLSKFIRDEYESLTNEIAFQYGFRGRNESYHKLNELLRIAVNFNLENSLKRDIETATFRLQEYLEQHNGLKY